MQAHDITASFWRSAQQVFFPCCRQQMASSLTIEGVGCLEGLCVGRTGFLVGFLDGFFVGLCTQPYDKIRSAAACFTMGRCSLSSAQALSMPERAGRLHAGAPPACRLHVPSMGMMPSHQQYTPAAPADDAIRSLWTPREGPPGCRRHARRRARWQQLAVGALVIGVPVQRARRALRAARRRCNGVCRAPTALVVTCRFSSCRLSGCATSRARWGRTARTSGWLSVTYCNHTATAAPAGVCLARARRYWAWTPSPALDLKYPFLHLVPPPGPGSIPGPGAAASEDNVETGLTQILQLAEGATSRDNGEAQQHVAPPGLGGTMLHQSAVHVCMKSTNDRDKTLLEC